MGSSTTSIAELRRQHTNLAEAQAAVSKCWTALGDRATNEILARLDSAIREVIDRIEIAEGGTQCDGSH